MAPDDKISPSADYQPLSSAAAKSVLIVCRVGASDEDGIRLKRMGICEGRRLQLVQEGDPLILRVVGCRVGISRQLAAQVWVKPCMECPEEVRS